MECAWHRAIERDARATPTAARRSWSPRSRSRCSCSSRARSWCARSRVCSRSRWASIPRELLTFRMEPPWRVNLQAPLDSLVPALTRDRDRAIEGYDARAAAARGAARCSRCGRGEPAATHRRLVDDRRAPCRSSRERRRRADPDLRRVRSRRAISRRWARECCVVGACRATDVAGGERVVVVDAEFARRAWGDADPLGRELLLDGPPNHAPPRAKVVGVVESIHMDQLDAELRPTMYVPFSQAHRGPLSRLGDGRRGPRRDGAAGARDSPCRSRRVSRRRRIPGRVDGGRGRAVDGEPAIPAARAGVLRWCSRWCSRRSASAGRSCSRCASGGASSPCTWR